MKRETFDRLLETLRQYAQERLSESGESDALRDRHFAYYLALVDNEVGLQLGRQVAGATLQRLANVNFTFD